MDPLSQPARSVLRLNAEHAYEELVVIGPGNADARAKLAEMTPQSVLAGAPVRADAAVALLAGLWLWHDCLDDSHQLSQSLQTTDGSFWHAIMHRREGDFSNSKYWYSRCANHPVYPALAAKASDIINPFPAEKDVLRITHAGWNTHAFVDLVESVHASPDDSRRSLCVALQQLEWRMLFDHCTRVVSGA